MDESEDNDWDEDARYIEDLNSPRRPGLSRGTTKGFGTGLETNTGQLRLIY